MTTKSSPGPRRVRARGDSSLIRLPGRSLADECRGSWESEFGAHRLEPEGLCCFRNVLRHLRRGRRLTHLGPKAVALFDDLSAQMKALIVLLEAEVAKNT